LVQTLIWVNWNRPVHRPDCAGNDGRRSSSPMARASKRPPCSLHQCQPLSRPPANHNSRDPAGHDGQTIACPCPHPALPSPIPTSGPLNWHLEVGKR